MNFDEWLLSNKLVTNLSDTGQISFSYSELLEFREWRKNNCLSGDNEDHLWGFLYKKYLNYLLALPDVDINFAVNEKHFTPFMIACEHGLIDMMYSIAALPNVNLNHQDKENQETAAHRAISHSTDECITALLEIPGIDWNVRNDLGKTPVMYATEIIESTEVLEKVLLNPQIDWDREDNDGKVTLHRILLFKERERKVKCLKILANIPGIDWNAHWTLKEDFIVCPMMYAAKDPNNDVMKIMADVPSINWNARLKGKFEEEHGTILHYALEQERFEFLRILFTLPNVEYDVKNLPRCTGCYDCKGRGCNTIMIWKAVLQKCLHMCREDHKRTGINYSDVVNFLNEAMQFASSHEDDIFLMKLIGFRIPGSDWE